MLPELECRSHILHNHIIDGSPAVSAAFSSGNVEYNHHYQSKDEGVARVASTIYSHFVHQNYCNCRIIDPVHGPCLQS